MSDGPNELPTERSPGALALLLVIALATAMLVVLIAVPPVREALGLGALSPLASVSGLRTREDA